MAQYQLEKSYSELVIRSATAWTFTEHASASIRHTDDFWIVESSEQLPDSKDLLLRNVNEMRLRELIDDQTADLRKAIVKRSLMNVYGE